MAGARRNRPLLLLVLVLAVIALYAARCEGDGNGGGGPEAAPPAGGVEAAWRDHAAGIMLQATGRVQRLLADDREGSRHQRFLLELPSGHTVLVAHNIDLAPRVPLTEGDPVTLAGRFEWNDRGGVIHWTHRDPDGRDAGGWIEHAGRRYD